MSRTSAKTSRRATCPCLPISPTRVSCDTCRSASRCASPVGTASPLDTHMLNFIHASQASSKTSPSIQQITPPSLALSSSARSTAWASAQTRCAKQPPPAAAACCRTKTRVLEAVRLEALLGRKCMQQWDSTLVRTFVGRAGVEMPPTGTRLACSRLHACLPPPPNLASTCTPHGRHSGLRIPAQETQPGPAAGR